MFDYDRFRAELDERCPVHRAQALIGAIETFPVGFRVGGYVREPGRDRWRCEYSSIKRRRDGSSYAVQHRSYTGAWSLALDVGMGSKHRAKDIEAIARAAHRAMLAQNLAALPPIRESAPIAEPVYLAPPAPPPPAPPEPPRIGEQFALAL